MCSCCGWLSVVLNQDTTAHYPVSTLQGKVAQLLESFMDKLIQEQCSPYDTKYRTVSVSELPTTASTSGEKTVSLKVCNSTKAFTRAVTSTEPPLCLQSRVNTVNQKYLLFLPLLPSHVLLPQRGFLRQRNQFHNNLHNIVYFKCFTHLCLRSARSPVFMIHFSGFILSRTSSLYTEASRWSRSNSFSVF